MTITLILGTLATASIVRALVTDRIALPMRQKVVARWGAQSLAAYWVHCPWCMSMWIAPPIMAIAVFGAHNTVCQFVLAALAARYVVGLLSQLEDN